MASLTIPNLWRVKLAIPMLRPGANQAPPGSPVPTQAPVIAASNGGIHPSTLSVTSPGAFTNNPSSYSYQWKKDGADYGAATATPQDTNSNGPGSYRLTAVATNEFGSNYSNSNTIAVTAEVIVDTTPDAFMFNDVTGADRATIYISNEITVSGINSPSPMTISGGAYSVNGDAFATANRNVVNGDKVRVRNTSSGSYSTGTDATLTIGGVSDTFSITTAAMPATEPAQMAAPTLEAGNGSIAVTRAAAPNDGGSPITGYDILYRQGSSGAFTAVAMTTNPQTLAGLTNGQPYEVATRAKNAVGNGLASPVATATPVAANVPIRDDFNRADNTALAEDPRWTNVSGLGTALRVTNQMLASAAQEGGFRFEKNCGPNHYIQAVAKSMVGVGPFLCTRFTDQNNFVGVRWNGNTGAIQLWKRIGGALTQIGTANSSSVDKLLRVEHLNDTARVLLDGVEIITPQPCGDVPVSNFTGAIGRTLAANPLADNAEANSL